MEVIKNKHRIFKFLILHNLVVTARNYSIDNLYNNWFNTSTVTYINYTTNGILNINDVWEHYFFWVLFQLATILVG